jgi:hypothetical protein
MIGLIKDVLNSPIGSPVGLFIVALALVGLVTVGFVILGGIKVAKMVISNLRAIHDRRGEAMKGREPAPDRCNRLQCANSGVLSDTAFVANLSENRVFGSSK